MGIVFVTLPVVNRLLVCRMQAQPDNKIPVAITANILRNFTNHMDGEKPSFLRTYVDPAEDEEGGLIGYLDHIVEKGKSKWLSEWGIKVNGKRGSDIFDYHDVKTDQDIARLLFKALKESLADADLKLPKNSRLEKARIVLVEGEVEQVKTVVSGLDEKSIIGLEYTEHEQWVSDIIAVRAWTLLKTTKSSLMKAENALRTSNKSRDEWKSRAETAEKAAEEKSRELLDLETFLWKEGPKVFEKVLVKEGYILPSRRMCVICEDKRKHNEENIPQDMINQSGFVEERCPLFNVGQQCEQCGARPPFCYSNEKVQVCKWATGDPCKRDHYGKIPIHTVGLHGLVEEDDEDLMKKIVNKFGECNFPEYKKYASDVLEADEDIF